MWMVHRSWGNFTCLNIMHFLLEVNCDLQKCKSVTKLWYHSFEAWANSCKCLWWSQEHPASLPGIDTTFSGRRGAAEAGKMNWSPCFWWYQKWLAGLMWSFVALWLKDYVVLIGTTNFKAFCFLQLCQFEYVKQFLLAFKILFIGLVCLLSWTKQWSIWSPKKEY